MQTPIKFFDSLADPRVERTRLHDLKDIIFITIAAVLSGCDDWNSIELYGLSKEEWLRKFLKLENGIPSHDTFNRLFAMLDPTALEACFAEWVSEVAIATEGQVVSIDGKRLCNSGQDGKSSIIHMVSAWSEANNMVLGQVKVDDKSNEITAIPALLKVLELKGCVITIDAMGCQRQIAEDIIDKEADYILAVKDNQGHLLDDIKEAFAESDIKPGHTNIQQEVDHGRVEKRCCKVIDDLDWICKHQWKGLRTIVCIESERYHKNTGVTQQETRYYISSLPPDAARLNKAIRQHWGIENGLHWSLDVVFNEDQSQKQAGNAAQNFSIINRIALNIIKNEKQSRLSMKNKRHKAGWDNDYLRKMLTVEI